MRTLRVALYWRFLLASLLPISLVGLISLANLVRETKEVVRQNSLMLAESLVREARANLDKAEESFTLLAGLMLEDLENRHPIRSEIDSHDFNEVMDSAVDSFEMFDSIYLIDSEGITRGVGLKEERRSRRMDYIGLDLSRLNPYLEAKHSKEVQWSDAFLSMISGESSLTISYPFQGNVLMANMKSTSLDKALEHVDPASGLEAILVDSKGVVMANSMSREQTHLTNLSNFEPVMRGFNSTGGTYDIEYGGDKYLVAVSPIRELGWQVLVMQKHSVAFSQVRQFISLFVVGMVVAMYLSFLAAYAISKRIGDTMAGLTSTTKAISGGNYEEPIPDQHYREMQDLAGNFSEMVDAVKMRETTLQTLAHTLLGATGSESLKQIVEEVCSNLNAETAVLATLNDEGELSVLEMQVDGESRVIEELQPDSLPLTETLEKGLCYVSSDARSRFPDASLLREANALGYLGIVLKGTGAEPIGILAAISRGELSLPQWKEQMVCIMAEKAAAEIERERAIAEQTLLEEELQQTRKMETVGRLAGGIAHDFNNMLTVLLGYGEMLVSELDDQSQHKMAASQIVHVSKRASNLVSQLMAFSRRAPQKRESVSIHQLIMDVNKLLMHTLDKKIRIRSKLEADIDYVEGDSSQLQSALLNLALNARDAMPDGGILSFETAIQEADPEHSRQLGLNPDSERFITVAVTDTGEGMTEEVLRKIFEPFFTTKGVGQGTGLGLAAVYGTMKSHGGAVEVSSTPGKGTRFTLYLPSADGAGDSQIDHQQRIASTLTGATVLIVEDEVAVRNLTEKFLRKLGYEVIAAVDGQDCVEIYAERMEEIDIVVLDVNMPRMNGREAIVRLLKMNPRAKVLIASGFHNEESDDVFSELGASGFLRKPFSLSEFSLMIAKTLETD